MAASKSSRTRVAIFFARAASSIVDPLATLAFVGLLGCSTGVAIGSDGGVPFDVAMDAVAGPRACAVGRRGAGTFSCNICTRATCCLVRGSSNSTCDDCIQKNCCTQLAACDIVTDGGTDYQYGGGTDYQGSSDCETFFGCVVDSATGAGGRDGSFDAAPDFEGGVSACAGFADSTARANALALLTCIQTNCASPCPGI